MAALAPDDMIGRLTMRPLKALCAAHGVDHGLAGKNKPVLVDRLIKIRKVTVGECEPHLSDGGIQKPAGVSKRTGVARAAATKKERLESYFAGGGTGLTCSKCSQSLRKVVELKARYGNHTFISVSCGRFPHCKQCHKLNDVYLDYKRMLCPRLVFEAHALRGIEGASRDACKSALPRIR